MGGGASTGSYEDNSYDKLSTAELTDKLSPTSQDVFLQYQDYCESCGLSPMESYLFLSAKFEELLALDRENAANMHDKTKEELQVIENLQRSSLYKDLKERMEMEAIARELNNALIEIDENAKSVASNNHENKTDTSVIADDGLTDMGEQEIAIEAMQEVAAMQDDLAIIDEIPEVAGSDLISSIFDGSRNDFQTRFAAAMQAPAAEFEKAARRLTQRAGCGSIKYDPKAPHDHECSLCLISFDNADDLNSHLKHSEFHQRKLALRNKRIVAAQEEALRLAHIATKVCNVMQEKGQEHSALETMKNKLLVRSKVFWRIAVKKVVVEHVTNQFVKRLDRHIDMPAGVKLLHSSSKHFHRTKATYDLQILLHHFDGCIEIVPHHVPYDHKTGKYDSAGKVLSCPRIYLSYMGVQMTMMGIDMPDAKLTFTSSFGSSKKRQLGKSFIAAETEAIITYIYNRLKVDTTLPPVEALYFDAKSVNAEVLLREAPKGIEVVPVQPNVIHLAWIEKHGFESYIEDAAARGTEASTQA